MIFNLYKEWKLFLLKGKRWTRATFRASMNSYILNRKLQLWAERKELSYQTIRFDTQKNMNTKYNLVRGNGAAAQRQAALAKHIAKWLKTSSTINRIRVNPAFFAKAANEAETNRLIKPLTVAKIRAYVAGLADRLSPRVIATPGNGTGRPICNGSGKCLRNGSGKRSGNGSEKPSVNGSGKNNNNLRIQCTFANRNNDVAARIAQRTEELNRQTSILNSIRNGAKQAKQLKLRQLKKNLKKGKISEEEYNRKKVRASRAV